MFKFFTRWGLAWVALLLLVAAGLVLRIGFARIDTFPSVDGVFYLTQSRDLVLYNRLSFSSFPPGWPILVSMSLLFMDAGDPLQVFRAAQGTNVVLGVLWPVLTFLLLRRHLGRWPALVGAGVLLALPLAITAAKGDLSEMSYGCALLAALLILPRDRLLAGLALGGAYLIRPEALLIALGVLVAVWWRERKVAWSLVLGVGLCLLPYVLFLHHHTGVWSLTGKMGFLDAALGARDSAAVLGLVGSNLKSFLTILPRLIGIPLVILSLVGLVARPRASYWALLALLPLPLFDFAMVDRFWLPYLPVVLLAAGLGARVVVETVKTRNSNLFSAVLLVVSLAGVVLVSGDDAFWVPRNPNSYYGMRDAGQWLRPRVTPTTQVAAYKPFTSFWAGCDFVRYPVDTSTSGLLDALQKQGVEYLIINFHVARLLVPQLKPLLQQPLDEKYADRVRVLAVFDYNPDDHTTVVFRLAPAADPEPSAPAARIP